VDHPKQSESVEELVVAAFEAESGALRSLEVAALAAERDEEPRLQARLERATELLRAALAELRPSTAGPVSAGFVLPASAPGDQCANDLDRHRRLKAVAQGRRR
jgi:hypothetical protein